MRWEKRITLQDGKPFQSRRICKEASAAEGSHPCCPSLRQSLARLQHCDRVLDTAFKKFEMIYLTRQHTGGFYPSNLAPLYSDCVPPSLDLTLVADQIVQFNDTLSQPGGPPSSTVESRWSSLVETILFDEELFQLWLFSIRQQWDFPNVWPPLVEMTVFSRSNNLSINQSRSPLQVVSLEKTNTSVGRSLARKIANNFLNNVLRSIQISDDNAGLQVWRELGKHLREVQLHRSWSAWRWWGVWCSGDF